MTGPGRPSLHDGPGHSPRVVVRLSPDLLERLDDWAARQGVTRAEAVRIALRRVLEE